MIHDDLFAYKIIKAKVINKWEDDFGFYTEQIKYFFLCLKGVFVANGKKQFYRGYM